MPDFITNLYHWYLSAWPAFTHSVMNHGHGEWATYWIMAGVLGICYAFFTLIILDVEYEDFWEAVRHMSIASLVIFLWPWLLLSLLPLAVGTSLTVVVISWFKALPSKEQRIERKQKKVSELRARKAEIA